MTIEPTTLIYLSLAGLALFCAIGYTRALLRERSAAVNHRITELETDYWREHEKIYARINSLERCCKPQEKCDKNFYNTGA